MDVPIRNRQKRGNLGEAESVGKPMAMIAAE